MRAASSREMRVRSAGPAFCKRLRNFHDFERIANGITERLAHVGNQSLYALVETASNAHHHLRQAPRFHLLLHECAGADFHVKHQSIQTHGQFLGHDGRGNQRNGFNRGRGVAQRIEFAIGRRNFGCLANERQLVLRRAAS